MEKAVPRPLQPRQEWCSPDRAGQDQSSASPRKRLLLCHPQRGLAGGRETQAINRSCCVRDGELAGIHGSGLRTVQKPTQTEGFHLCKPVEGAAEGLVESKPTFCSALAVLFLCLLGRATVGPEHWHSTDLREVLQSSSVQMLQPRKQEMLNKNPVSQLAFPCILGVYKSTCMCLAKHLIKWRWVAIFTQLMPLYWQLLSLVQWSCPLFLKAWGFVTTTCS